MIKHLRSFSDYLTLSIIPLKIWNWNRNLLSKGIKENLHKEKPLILLNKFLAVCNSCQHPQNCIISSTFIMHPFTFLQLVHYTHTANCIIQTLTKDVHGHRGYTAEWRHEMLVPRCVCIWACHKEGSKTQPEMFFPSSPQRYTAHSQQHTPNWKGLKDRV